MWQNHKSPIDTCPCCGSHNITQYTRVIGYLRPTKAFGSDRQQEAKNRIYSDGKSQV
ncbi:anaerobic ribonucleoside-triphosphate reductase [Bacteroides thetaiotaomicron]|uniref:anaerobic ribonucleoside-triphosphate reductase n=1 Tax=Bacteroides thetaiotaomicron TaxID=818 RepID=UPI0039C88322